MSKDQWRSPAGIAKKLGLTVKALRVYEREGLVQPHRLSTGRPYSLNSRFKWKVE